VRSCFVRDTAPRALVAVEEMRFGSADHSGPWDLGVVSALAPLVSLAPSREPWCCVASEAMTMKVSA